MSVRKSASDTLEDASSQGWRNALCGDAHDDAYDWLCQARTNAGPSADVWDLRRNWKVQKALIRQELSSGQFRFGLLRRIEKNDGGEIELWSARDALVLKALSIVLSRHLPSSPRCTHLKNHGGAKEAVRQVQRNLGANGFVLRTDVKSYYASIGHVQLMERLARFVPSRIILNLCGQYLKRTAEMAGWFYSPDRGISLGCPLSPLMGAFFLLELDNRMAASGLFYVRFMDDILILSPTRSKLRSAVRTVNAVLAGLGLEKHPDKTFIGRITRGFDFLGYHFGIGALTVADATIERFVAHAILLYEQGRMERIKAPLLGMYVRRWRGWAKAGVHGLGDDCSASLATSISTALSRAPKTGREVA